MVRSNTQGAKKKINKAATFSQKTHPVLSEIQAATASMGKQVLHCRSAETDTYVFVPLHWALEVQSEGPCRSPAGWRRSWRVVHLPTPSPRSILQQQRATDSLEGVGAGAQLPYFGRNQG